MQVRELDLRKIGKINFLFIATFFIAGCGGTWFPEGQWEAHTRYYNKNLSDPEFSKKKTKCDIYSSHLKQKNIYFDSCVGNGIVY